MRDQCPPETNGLKEDFNLKVHVSTLIKIKFMSGPLPTSNQP